MQDHDKLCSEKKVISDPNIFSCHTNMLNVDFYPAICSENMSDSIVLIKQSYNQSILTLELLRRGLSSNTISTMNFEAKAVIEKYLIEEKHIDYILLALERTRSTKDVTLIIVEQTIHCVLHFNMRITENCVRLLLQEGLNKFYDTIERDNCKLAADDFMNQRALDISVHASIQWYFPVSIRDPITIVESNFRGNQAELSLKKYEDLVDTCSFEEERKLHGSVY